jgi:hypothetical protein
MFLGPRALPRTPFHPFSSQPSRTFLASPHSSLFGRYSTSGIIWYCDPERSAVLARRSSFGLIPEAFSPPTPGAEAPQVLGSAHAERGPSLLLSGSPTTGTSTGDVWPSKRCISLGVSIVEMGPCRTKEVSLRDRHHNRSEGPFVAICPL